MRRLSTLLFCLLNLLVTAAVAQTPEVSWFERTAKGEPQVQLYFFWSKKCPHCLDSLPYLEMLEEDNPWIKVHSYQLVGNDENVRLYQLVARGLGKEARSVPGFVFCRQMMTGFDARSTPDILLTRLQQCRQYLQSHADLSGFVSAGASPLDEGVRLELPLIGTITSGIDSLAFITVAIAAVDAFNPCAFFVLMFLLSMMLHSGSRKRMLLVGGIFVFFSGLIYFLFMSAWLNLFRLIGQIDVITAIAALLAIIIALINIKDYFWFKQGISLTIKEDVKPGIYHRVRQMLHARSILAMSLAAASLAALANLYEFFCTAGFPMVYTRILTLSELSTTGYYLYLLLYNLIYVIPLLVIVFLFVFSFGSRKLQQSEGRSLKLVSGLMMLVLGLALLIQPSLLNDVVAALGLMLLAVISSVIIIVGKKWQEKL